LADLVKQEIVLSELNAIETQLAALIHKGKELFGKNEQLEEQLLILRKENSFLQQQVSSLENEIKSLKSDSENNLFNSLNLKERENLKIKLQNLISKIDYHLSS
jgi:cell division protein FtsB